MSSAIQLVFVIHNHQPVGNFDAVFHEACDAAYLPFLRMLLEFPELRFGLHTSGCLLEWCEQHRPEYGEVVRELRQRGQLELLGGGMYEPILPVLPARDALWQLTRMSGYIEERFGVRPQGMWCPERIWEPHLPELIARAGLRYTLLDDSHFRSCALPEEIRGEYFTTEHAGHRVSLFPISKELRYLVPFQPVDDCLDFLRKLGDEAAAPPLAVFGDDGEKFGIWPDTHDWVYGSGWLKDFFTALAESRDWLRLCLPAEVLEQRQPASQVFIPARSYAEMGEWTRIGDDGDDAALPGHWRNYFRKYPESKAMHDRVTYVSALLQQARDLGFSDNRLAEAADHLGRAQCNCSYWHGVFGGIYLNYLRHAVSHHASRAEVLLRGLLLSKYLAPEPAAGAQRVLANDELNITVDTQHGLCLTRLDYLPTGYCWTDVLARRREAYHAKLDYKQDNHSEHASIHDLVRVKEPGLQELLVVDPQPRASFTTYFSNLEQPAELLTIASAQAAFAGRAAVDYLRPAELTYTDQAGLAAEICFEPLVLRKSIKLLDNGIEFAVERITGQEPDDYKYFVLEFNLTLLTDQADDRQLVVDGKRHELNSPGVDASCNKVQLIDGWQGRVLTIHANDGCRLMHYPVYTVSSSEGGFERTFQGTCLMFAFPAAQLKSTICLALSVEAIRP